ADRERELRHHGGDGGHGQRAHEQVRRRAPQEALLRRLRGCGRGGAARDRPGEGAVRGGARERAAALRGAGEHGRLPRGREAGLLAAGIHPSPVPHAQIVTTTTHKTLRGPRGGLILCQEAFGKDVDKQVFPGIQGGPLEHVIAAKAVALGEALTPAFKQYAIQVVTNAQALAAALVQRGYAIVSGGTDTHLMLVDLRPKGLTGKEAQALLDRAGISVNK